MSDSQDENLSSTKSVGGIGSLGFIGLLLTQLLGTLNDNMFRWFAVVVAQPVLKRGEDDSLALSVGLACFTLPYLLLAVPAGYFGDRFSKRTVIVLCKIAEILIMVLGIASLMSGNVWIVMGVVALMGAQAALFGPAKYGAIPELVRDEQLSTANGLMSLVTVGASAAGMIAGYALFGMAKIDMTGPVALSELLIPAIAFIGVAVLGTLTCLPIPRLQPADPNRRMERNPISAVVRDMKLLFSNPFIYRTALGVAFFWMLASLANLNIDPYGMEVLGMKKESIGILGAILVCGLGTGSVLAGLASGGKVELGIVPVGAMGITVSCILLYVSGQYVDPSIPPTEQTAFYVSCGLLFLLGGSAGFFDIPLEANLQHRTDISNRGTILAATNFLTFSFILGASAVFYLLKSVCGLSSSVIFLVAGIGTIPVIWHAFHILPQVTIRFVVWCGSLFFYRIRVVGKDFLPEKGGALIVANHVSWLDGILLLMVSDRPIRMLAYSDYCDLPGLFGWITRTFGTIPINASDGPKALLRSLKTAKQAVIDGELVCIFAEGALTRTGQLQKFERGMLRIVEGTGCPVVPCYLDQLWGSVFSFHGGKFFWKWPRHWPYPITILFGKPLADPDSANEVRNAVEELGVEAVNHRHNELIPIRQFLRSCRSARSRAKVADSVGMELTGGKLLAASIMFSRVLKRDFLKPNEKFVGVLLPPSVPGVLANTAISLLGKVPVNLNYTLSDDVVNFCIREAGITHVLTSKKFLEKKPMTIDAQWIFVEDIKAGMSKVDKAVGAFSGFVEPVWLLERRLGLTKIKSDELMTVIFTSGSTGEPKGVMLSHANVGANIHSADQLFQIADTDVLLGVLPFFHSFGFTLMMWLPLTLAPKGVYHFNPLDGRTVGTLCEKHKVTIIAATPTFLKQYLKRCTKEQMQHVDLAICGAEKLPASLAEEFFKTYGIYPTEGFGTTELSPLAAANVPDHRNNAAGTGQTGTRMGTVGRPVPNVAARVVDPDTGIDLGLNKPGLLHIKGPNVMVGYLNQPAKTAEVIRDGWYNTGDIAVIDDDGFITITGRLSRFSKIGGEMVPHIRIEEELMRLVEDPAAEEAEVRIAVTAVPDESKGERLVVLHRPLTKPIAVLLNGLSAAGLPNLWLPGSDCFFEVDSIPLLGTGKLDLRGIKKRAAELMGIEVAK